MAVIESERIRKNILLSDYSTFGIGGAAKQLIEIDSIGEMSEIIKECSSSRTPYIVIGKGSNCLFDSSGFDGLVIVNRIDFLENQGEGRFRAGAGYNFSLLGLKTARDGWSGLEFASGIPASVGGAVYMNAGASGKETCEPLESVEFIDHKGGLHSYAVADLTFAYRRSSFQSIKGAVVSATFKLDKLTEARKNQISIVNYRKETQPYGEMSAGCIFRNPSGGDSAGSLIEQAGLKGIRVGDAKVSEKHANFIVNSGNATSDDVKTLIAQITETIKKKFNITLQSEVRQIDKDNHVSS